MIQKEAKKKQATHSEQGYQKSDKAAHTAKELATIAGVSHDTIHRVEVIEEKAEKAECIDMHKMGKITYNMQKYAYSRMNNLISDAKNNAGISKNAVKSTFFGIFGQI